MSGIACFFASLAVGIPLAIFRAFVIVKWWTWFIVPYFGVRPINRVIAYALVWTAGLIAQHYVPIDDSKSAWRVLGETVLQSLMVTLMGWASGAVVHAWL